MMYFDYEFKHVAGKVNKVADLFSRAKYHSASDRVKLPTAHFSQTCISIDTLKSEYATDHFLQGLKRRLIDADWSNLTPREKFYKRYQNALTVEDDIIRHGSRIIPPQCHTEESSMWLIKRIKAARLQ